MIKKISIKSMAFSGLLAFSFMGIDNAICANKAIYNLVEYYSSTYSPSLLQDLKSDIITIVDTKIEGESLFDLLIRYQNSHFKLSHQHKNEAIESVFADTRYDVNCSTIGRKIIFSPKNKRYDDITFEIFAASITDYPYMANQVSIRILSPRVEGDRVNVLDCVVIKQKSGEYQLEISI